ncbi:nucleotide-diphospho-sugar transferase [Lipomyces tetrasporus]
MILSPKSHGVRRFLGLIAVLVFAGVAVLTSREILLRTEFSSDSQPPPPLPGFDRPSRTEAKVLSAKDVLSRPLATNFGVMPKLIHQSWSDQNLPAKFDAWSRSCREQNPDWEWVLWTDQDNLDLVKKHFPWFLEYYEKMPGEIFRVDLVRNMYMYVYGGIYADLDVECLRPADELFESYNVTTVPYATSYDETYPSISNTHQQKRAFFGRMGTEDDFEHSIPNAWMASTPGHPFFLLTLESVAETLKGGSSYSSAEDLTGPLALKNNIELYNTKYADSDALDQRLYKSPVVHVFGPQYKQQHAVTVLPFWAVFPYSWARDGIPFRGVCSVNSNEHDSERCKLLIAADHWGSYFITYWSHSWSPNGHDEGNLKNIEESDEK